MALVSGNGSGLNPNAPIFVPAAFHQVEDFSPAWWDLVKSSAWFRHYWLTLHQDDDYFDASQEPEEEILDDELADLEAEFEELVLSEAKSETPKSPAKNDTDVDVGAVLENLGVTVRGSPPRGRGPKSAARLCSKAAPCLKVKFGPGWRIQQPR